jgi:hypothetical protein
MESILFSTTRQFNPGDEWILKGILNLIPPCNPIIFNRHFGCWGNPPNNSFQLRLGMSGINYYVAAGTPQWSGKSFDPLFTELLNNEVRCSLIGVGMNNKITPKCEQILDELTDLVIVRDYTALDHLQKWNPILLPCPAMFATDIVEYKEFGPIGLVYMTNMADGNKISDEARTNLIKQYQYILANFKCRIICHTITEYTDALQHFPVSKIRYSYESSDYFKYYKECSLVIGHRLHGGVLAAGMGIPAIGLLDKKHNLYQTERRQALEVMGCPLVDEFETDLSKMIINFDHNEEHRRLLDFRERTEYRYRSILSSVFTQ